nr:hypothetical protein [Aeromonas sp. 2692-1]
MLRLCYRAILLCWFTCWSLVAAAETSLDKDQLGLAERLWLASRNDLVVGMPSMAWPPTSMPMAGAASTVRSTTLPPRLPAGWG